MVYEEVKSEPMEMHEFKNEGDSIEGEVEEIREGEYGSQYKINGKWTPSHKVLQGRMADGKVKVGTKVRITFEKSELPKVKGFNPTSIYKVEVDR